MASETHLDVVLVIGGCGYLGSSLVTLLKSEPSCSSVHVMSRNPTTNIQTAVTYHAGDIASETDVNFVFEKVKPTVIFHTASPKYTASRKALRHTNIDGTRTLLKFAAKSESVKAFVYTSSDSTLLQNPGVVLTEETCEIHTEFSTNNAYAETKAMADAEVRAANDPPNLLTAVLRIPSLWGENDDNSMASLLSMVKNKQTTMQIGENKHKFEFVYTPKACEAHILAAKALLLESSSAITGPKGKVNGEAFFISNGKPVPYFDFARKVFSFAGHPVDEKEVKVMPYWVVLWFAVLGEWFTWAYSFGRKTPEVRQKGIEYLGGGTEWNITKAKEILGYVPLEDRDLVLKRVTEEEAKRLGVE